MHKKRHDELYRMVLVRNHLKKDSNSLFMLISSLTLLIIHISSQGNSYKNDLIIKELIT